MSNYCHDNKRCWAPRYQLTVGLRVCKRGSGEGRQHTADKWSDCESYSDNSMSLIGAMATTSKTLLYATTAQMDATHLTLKSRPIRNAYTMSSGRSEPAPSKTPSSSKHSAVRVKSLCLKPGTRFRYEDVDSDTPSLPTASWLEVFRWIATPHHCLSLVPDISSCASRTRKLSRISLHSHQYDTQTYLYHNTVGNTVPRCHRLCASNTPCQGGKSSNSKLIATIIHATQRPGHTAHVRPVF